MKLCAFLTMDRLDEFEHYDYMLNEPLTNLGWEVSDVSWRNRNVDWDRFEVVIIRTPWDYHHDAGNFLKVLKEIDQSSARLENALELVEWNIDKTYLGDLKEKGIPIVPTRWGQEREGIDKQQLLGLFDYFETDEIIVKPNISAGADNTYRLTREGVREKLEEMKKVFAERSYMIQPLMRGVLDEGEYSLIYFGHEYSHTLLKTPKQSDFRVQEEHGGILKTVEPGKKLRKVADRIITSIHPVPLYSRVDLVRAGKEFLLMELELIEPSLYFNMDPESPERFARFFDEWMKVKAIC